VTAPVVVINVVIDRESVLPGDVAETAW